MPTLLGLPRELRDKILFEVVTQPTTAPKKLDDPETRTTRHPDGKGSGWGYGQEVMFHGHWNRTTSIPTLLVNRQLHAETLSAIDRLTSNDYVLDIMMVNDKQLWPTWLLVPRLATTVDKVSAGFRIFGAAKRVEESGFRGGCSGPSGMAWTLFIFLDRFLNYGPVGLWQRKTETSIVALKELDMNFDHSGPPCGDLEDYCGGDYNVFSHIDRRRKDGIDCTMHPEILLRFVSTYIDVLLYMTDPTADFGTILYERVGKIRILYNGEIRKEWDLAVLLSGQENFSSRHYLNEWRIRTYNLRVELGLPVLPLKEL